MEFVILPVNIMNQTMLIEYLRSGVLIPTESQGNILTIKTSGFANEILDSVEFRKLVSDIAHGLESPLFDLTPYLEETYYESGEKNRKHAQQSVKLNIVSTDNMAVIKVMLMNESKLSKEERARLYCRRLGYCDTNIFKIMGSKSEFGNFPKLMVLNEDNIESTI